MERDHDYRIFRQFVRADWQQHGACNGHEHPEWWFPHHGDDGINARKAKAICATCPVQTECLTYAETNEKVGIWGGVGIDSHRRQIATPRPTLQPRPPTTPGINHGTLGGFHAERRRGIPPCDDCREARNNHRRAVRLEGRVA